MVLDELVGFHLVQIAFVGSSPVQDVFLQILSVSVHDVTQCLGDFLFLEEMVPLTIILPGGAAASDARKSQAADKKQRQEVDIHRSPANHGSA